MVKGCLRPANQALKTFKNTHYFQFYTKVECYILICGYYFYKCHNFMQLVYKGIKSNIYCSQYHAVRLTPILWTHGINYYPSVKRTPHKYGRCYNINTFIETVIGTSPSAYTMRISATLTSLHRVHEKISLKASEDSPLKNSFTYHPLIFFERWCFLYKRTFMGTQINRLTEAT